MNKGIKDLALGLCVTMLSITQAHAYQDIGKPSAETLKSLYPGKTYSPYAQRAFPDRVYWGDTHLHTALSPDAGLFATT
jgi:hypothetical protein